MAITRALLPKQLQAGAPDITLTGDQSHRGTYTQRRRAQMAGGGIMGSNAGSMLVAPTADGSRPRYGWLDDVGDFLSSAKDKFVDDIIPNEIKENPLVSTAALGALANQLDLIPGDMSSQNWLGDLIGRDTVIGDKGIFEGGSELPDLIDLSNLMPGGSYPNDESKPNPLYELATNVGTNLVRNYLMGSPAGTGISQFLPGYNPMDQLTRFLPFGQTAVSDEETGTLPFGLDFIDNIDPKLKPYLRYVTKAAVPGRDEIPARYETSPPYGDTVLVPGTGIPAQPEQAAEYGVKVNPLYPIGAGLAAGLYQSKQPRDELPMDQTSINIPQTAAAALADPNLRFKPVQAAQGGRIGFADGSDKSSVTRAEKMANYKALSKLLDYARQWPPFFESVPIKYHQAIDDFETMQKERFMYGEPKGITDKAKEKILRLLNKKAQGGRIGAQEGGLMDLGGMEKDYREEGGFVPIGGEEKADDVPARLSKNEFVFTADAVRNAGDGDIDEGAAVMERLMKHLEAGGTVSEDSQGLEGAREMFARTQQLEKRII